MANHISLDEAGSKGAREIVSTIRRMEADWAKLKAVGADMGAMKQGDGSSADHFALVVANYGVEAEAGVSTALEEAKTLHDELLSTLGNSAALEQLFSLIGP
jgi:hypothetical protein